MQETAELQKKQAWYQQNQISMRQADEQDYLSYCEEAMFRIRILEQRLNRCAFILLVILSPQVLKIHVVNKKQKQLKSKLLTVRVSCKSTELSLTYRFV